MVEREPVTELSAFSSEGAVPTGWAQARGDLRDAEVYWLSTVRPGARPHVTPLLGIWSKYGPHFTAPGGTWFGLGDAIRGGDVLVYRVAPSTAFGFGKGKQFSQTRFRFS